MGNLKVTVFAKSLPYAGVMIDKRCILGTPAVCCFHNAGRGSCESFNFRMISEPDKFSIASGVF